MSDNYRKLVGHYSQWCDPNRKGPKQRVYRPYSMRQVDASAELNRLLERIAELEAQLTALQVKLTNTEWHLANEANLHAEAAAQLTAVNQVISDWQNDYAPDPLPDGVLQFVEDLNDAITI